MSGRTPSLPRMDALVIRPAYPDDHTALARLAQLDSQRPLRLPALVAERDGHVLAALSAVDGRTIANPFAPTADLVALLRVRAAADPSAPAKSTSPTWAGQGLLRRVGTTARRGPALARG